MKYLIEAAVLLFITIHSFSQNKSVRYKDKTFENVSVTKDILYDTDKNIKTKYREFDLYKPENDSLQYARPLIIWMHGGGFKFGSKNAKEIKIWGRYFAQCGYVFAAINYRLSKSNTLKNFKNLVKACYDNVDDANKATSFLKQHAHEFGIDTNKIIIGGNSAGGIIALQSVYSNKADIQNVIDSNRLIAHTGNYNSENFAAVINFWGAMFNDKWLSRAKVPVVSVHGAKDKIVHVTHTGVTFFGSLDIHKKADDLHIPNDVKIYQNYAHELQKHFNPLFRSKRTKQRWKEAAQFAANFLYTVLLK